MTTPARGQAVPPPPDPGSLAALPPPEPKLPERRWFRLGYLRPAPDAPLGRRWHQGLKRALQEDATFRAATAREGFEGVALRPCDGAEDMLQRMGQNEFEIVFCPAMVYAQARILNPGQYRVVFQTRRRGVDYADSRGGHLRRRGAVFVRRGTALDRPDLSAETLKNLLATRRMAVSGSYDAAGFFYVRKMLLEDYDGTRPGDFLYCGSPDEVVKNVTAGLAEVGACEESALRRVLDEALPREVAAKSRPQDDALPFLRVILRTDWVPTDPVAFRDEFDPRYRRSPVGQAAAAVLRRVYAADDHAPQLETGDDAAYDRMADDVRLTPHLTRGEGW